MPRDFPNHPRARRVLLLSLLLLALGELAVGLALDHAPPGIRFSESVEIFDHARALTRPPDVAILGSSRLASCFDPDALEGQLRQSCGRDAPQVFGAAVLSADSVAMKYMLDQLLEMGVRPRLALVEVSPEFLAPRDFWMNHNLTNVLTLPQIAAYLPEVVYSRRFSKLYAARCIPTHTFREGLRRWSADALGLPPGDWFEPPAAPDPPALPPWTPPDLSQRWQLSAAGVAGLGPYLADYHIGRIQRDFLEALLDRCHREGIAVILVGAPAISAERQQYTPQVESVYSGYVDDLCRRYGCTYCDLRARLADGEFYDVYHASIPGAGRFSRILASETIVPWWQAHAAATQPR